MIKILVAEQSWLYRNYMSHYFRVLVHQPGFHGSRLWWLLNCCLRPSQSQTQTCHSLAPCFFLDMISDSNSTDLLWFIQMRNDRFLSTSHMVRQVFWCVKVQQSRSHFAEPDSRLLSFPWSAKTITWYYLYGFSRKSLVFVILVRVYRKKIQ